MTIHLKRAALLALLPLAAAHCAPERARAIREDRSLTLGWPIGVSYRPTGKVGIGTRFTAISDEKVKVENTDKGTSTLIAFTDGSTSRDVTHSQTNISPFVQVFPWDTSAFFVGGSGSYRRATYKYDEEVAGWSAAPTYTNVSYQNTSTYVGAPVGWAWIWTPGFSLTLDAEPRWRAARSTSYSNNGEGNQVNVAQRDSTKHAIDGTESAFELGLDFLIGWSF